MSVLTPISGTVRLQSDAAYGPALPSFEVPVLALMGVVGLLLGLDVGLVAPRLTLALATGGLVIYLAFESYLLRGRTSVGSPWLISPIVVASVYSLGVAFGLTNALFWISAYRESLPPSRAPDLEWSARATLYALAGACAMWTGFRSVLGPTLGQALWRSRGLSRILRTSYEVRWSVVGVCIVFSIVSRLVQVRLGLYGVLRDATGPGGSSHQLLNYGARLGLVALIGTAAHVFSRPNARTGLRILLTSLVLHETAWGALAADKKDTVLPVIVLGLLYYALRRRLPIRLALVAVGLLAASYLVLMPLRKASGDLNNRSVTAVGSAALAMASQELLAGTPGEGTTNNVGLAALQRLNSTATAALALRYHDVHPEDPVPETFASTIFLTPVYTLIPLAVWPGRPRAEDVGHWFYKSVLGGRDQATLAGTTLVGYLNFAGGILAVLLGFWFIGVMQRVVHERFLLASGGGALFILMGFLGPLGDLPTQYGSILAQPLRTLPLLLVVQFILFRPAAQVGRN